MVGRTLGTPKTEIGKSKLEIGVSKLETRKAVFETRTRSVRHPARQPKLSAGARGIMPQSRGERHRETKKLVELRSRVCGRRVSRERWRLDSPDFRLYEWLTPGGALQANYGSLMKNEDGGELPGLPRFAGATTGVRRTAKLKLSAIGTLSGDFVEVRGRFGCERALRAEIGELRRRSSVQQGERPEDAVSSYRDGPEEYGGAAPECNGGYCREAVVRRAQGGDKAAAVFRAYSKYIIGIGAAR